MAEGRVGLDVFFVHQSSFFARSLRVVKHMFEFERQGVCEDHRAHQNPTSLVSLCVDGLLLTAARSTEEAGETRHALTVKSDFVGQFSGRKRARKGNDEDYKIAGNQSTSFGADSIFALGDMTHAD